MNAATAHDLAVLIAALQKDAAARRATEETKEDAPYGAGAAASSSGKHQTKAQKEATDSKKQKKSADHADKKYQNWLAKQ